MTARSITLAILLCATFATGARATVLCGARVGATGQLRDGATLRVRATCRANEVAVDPAQLGGGSVASDTLAFPPETAIGGTATLYIAPTGIQQNEPDARTPVAGGTLRGLRCYVSTRGGGGGLDVALGVGACNSPLVFGPPQLTFSGDDTNIAKDSGSESVNVSSGQCIALRVRTLGMTDVTQLNCTLERHAPG